jgi:aminopeptidase N
VQNYSSLSLDLVSLTVDSVFCDSQRVDFVRTRTRLYPEWQFSGGCHQVIVYYHGTPSNDGFGGFFFGDNYIYTVGQGIYSDPPSMFRYWTPSHDVPSDKAILDAHITVPSPLQAISNGLCLRIEENPDSTKTYHWRESHPIATYLIALAVGEFAVCQHPYVSTDGDTIPIEFYTYPERFNITTEDWKNLPQMMAFFESLISPYPFDRYSMVELPNRGAMEHQTMTSYSTNLVTGDHRFDYVVAHELAHHWWGNWVTLSDWREIWLNEGFATYCEALYMEFLHGEEEMISYMADLATLYYQEVQRLGFFSIYDPDYLWGATIYQKGAWTLHMLRWLVGDSCFFDTMREYGRSFGYGNSTIADFKLKMEINSGKDLTSFFDQWIYAASTPQLRVGWDYRQSGADTFDLKLRIDQTQSGGFFYSLPLEVEIQTESGAVLDTIVLQKDSEVFVLSVSPKPEVLIIDPRGWLLKEVDIFQEPLPEGFRAGELALAQSYPNPFLPDGEKSFVEIGVQIGLKHSPLPVSLKIYNVLGQEIETLVERKMSAGLYTFVWDGTDNRGDPVPSGLYFYQLKSPEKVLSKRMSIIRR